MPLSCFCQDCRCNISDAHEYEISDEFVQINIQLDHVIESAGDRVSDRVGAIVRAIDAALVSTVRIGIDKRTR